MILGPKSTLSKMNVTNALYSLKVTKTSNQENWRTFNFSRLYGTKSQISDQAFPCMHSTPVGHLSALKCEQLTSIPTEDEVDKLSRWISFRVDRIQYFAWTNFCECLELKFFAWIYFHKFFKFAKKIKFKKLVHAKFSLLEHFSTWSRWSLIKSFCKK